MSRAPPSARVVRLSHLSYSLVSVSMEHDPPSVQAFAAALQNEGNEHVTSASDWAPKNPVQNRQTDDANYGIGYTLLRWPVLIITWIWVDLLLIFYSGVRVYVALNEWLVVWRGKRQSLRRKLRASTSYQEWQHWAHELDHYLGLDKWQDQPQSSFYDHRTMTKLVRQLDALGAEPETNLVAAETSAIILEGCLKYNFSGMHNPGLYSQCYGGTKNLVAQFNRDLVQQVDHLASPTCPLPASTKGVLFESFSKNLGKSALCLSGGATFSYRHFGVVKALLDQDLLPRIVSGTSGGGLVAAFVCTHTDDELRAEIRPELADHITACGEPFPQWLFRMARTGARFDVIDWARRCRFFTKGDLTFREAYERTGKILNISTVPSSPHSPVILANYITAPDCVIWTAMLASAAVPGILKPVVLMMKTRQGEFVPWSFGSRWKDGSLRTDIPTAALNTFFNVNFTIVSQVNPHIRLFAYLPRGQVGRPVIHKFSTSRWRGGFASTALESVLKLEIQKCMRLVRDLDLMPHLLDQDWSHVFLQKFEGSVTVWPRIRLLDFWYILSDPTREQLKSMIEGGERSIYPKLSMIRDFMNLERAVAAGVEQYVSGSVAPSRAHSPDAAATADVMSQLESNLEQRLKHRNTR